MTTEALYELATPKTLIEVREEIERMIEAGDVGMKYFPTSSPTAYSENLR
ncbi:hypothetical protein [Rhizobium rhizogenes]|nr:hypothetical protein [Rhizobium rhizogenes]NTI74239.1 hypothetical protein [Rhizobium rhizogenes]